MGASTLTSGDIVLGSGWSRLPSAPLACSSFCSRSSRCSHTFADGEMRRGRGVASVRQHGDARERRRSAGESVGVGTEAIPGAEGSLNRLVR